MTPKSNKPNQNKNTSNPKIKFEIFQNADDQLHYFHLKDSNDRAFLFSQGYKTSKSRDRGLQSTVNNLVKPDRYFKVSEGEQPYFILKSGNNQRIAKSCNFKSIAEMNEYLELITCQELEIPIRSLDEKVQKAPSNTISEKTEKRREPTEKLPRYSFRINMYPDSGSGKIIHVFSGKERSFIGLNQEAILGFIKENIPAEVEKPSHTRQKTSLPVMPKAEEIKCMELRSKGKLSSGHIINNTQPYDLEIDLPYAKEEEEKICRFFARVFAKSLNNGQQKFLGEWKEEISQNKNITLPIYFNNLSPGLYRLNTTITLNGCKTLNGSKLIELQ